MELDAIQITALDRETVRALSVRTNGPGLVQLGAHITLLGMTGALVWASRGSLWLAVALFVHGIVLSFFFCTLHECIHRTAFATRRINDCVAWLCGALLMLPPEYFRLFHFAHHRFTQNPQRDPELAQPKPTSVHSYLWHISGLPYWQDRVRVILTHALTGRIPETFVPAGKHAVVVREARIFLSCYLAVAAASLMLGQPAVFLYWIFPALLGQPLLRIFLLAEHVGCAQDDNMFANTRTTYTHAAVRFLAWQMSFHAEHHAFPSVPFHALGKTNGLTRSCVLVSSAGYFALHRRILQKLRLPAAVRE